VIIVDTLNIFSCSLFFLRYRKDKKVLYIFKAKGRGVDFLIRMMRRRNWEFTEIDYELGSGPGGSDFIRLQKKYQEVAQKEIRPEIRKKIDKCLLFSDREKEIIASYLGSSIEAVLYHGLEILHSVESVKKCFGMPTVLLQSTPLKSVLRKEYAKREISVRFYKAYSSFRFRERKEYYEKRQIFSLKYNKSFVSKLARFLSVIVRDLILCVCLLFRSPPLSRFFHLPPRSKNSGHFDICAIVPAYERNLWFHDLNWRVDSMAKTWRVLGLIYGITDERFSLYRGLADQWIDFRGFLFEKGAFPIYDWMLPGLFSVSIWNLWRIFRNLFVLGFSWHLAIHLSELLWEESKLETLFRNFQIKLLWTNIEGIDRQATAAAIAIHRVGGVSLGSTWSVYAYPDMTGQRNTNDIFFAWGKRHVTIFQGANAACQNFIMSGYLGDFYLPGFQKEAQKLRGKWLNEFGPKFVICYYDNIFLRNIYVTRSSVLNFFNHLLPWLKKRPEILFVFKSKKRDAFENYPVEIKEILMEMEKKKQLVYSSELADLAPGLASDVIIGLYTATLPSLLASYGKEVILFDNHRLYKEWPVFGLKNVTFVEKAAEVPYVLEGVLEKQRTAQKNIAPCPSELDPFCDGKATARINDYFSDLLTGLKMGNGSDAAISVANERYRAKWGSDKVLLNKSRV